MPISLAMGSPSRTGARRPSVRSRILAAVLLPLVLVSVLVLQVMAERNGTVAATRALRDRTDALAEVAGLRDRVFDERRQYETVARSAAVGLSPEAVSSLLGMPVVVDPSAARAATDAALAAIAPGDRPFSPVALDDLRRGIDGGALSADEASERFDALEMRTVSGVEAALDEVGERAVAIGDVPLQRTVRVMRDAVRAVGSRGGQVRALSEHWFAQGAEAVPALAALAHATRQHDQLSADLASAPVPAVAEAWRRRSTVGGVFDAAVQEVLAGRAGPAAQGDLTQLGRVLGDGLQDYAAIGEIPAVAAAAVGRAASDRGADARRDVERAAVGALVAIAVSVAAALWFGRSIARPLRLLAVQAQQVRDGELRLSPLALAGPPELSLASAAFNDVTANLVLMEEKALALSACDFDSPALSRTLPGRLGEALHDSLQVLSGSILERESLQARLLHQATHDSLTGLANRPAVIDALAGAVERSRRSGHPLAVSFIDLDDFKTTNDTSGHAIGDALLRAVAERMRAAARRGDMVARLGGDEFVVVAEEVGGAEEALALVRRILDAIAAPIELDGREFRISGSAGIALNRAGDDDPLTLLANADLAVYRAKHRSASSIELYDEELQGQARARTDIEAALAATLLRGGDELVLHFQPILDARSERVVSLEALVRWDRPGEGLVAPDDFIPVAERSDLVVRLDQWVIEAATAQMASWSGHPVLGAVTLAVNVSGRHVADAHFVDHVRGALATSGFSPERLVLEVTETALVADMARAAAQIALVRELGVKVAVDDFGTGHTGLTHIRTVTVDEIKIDRSFTAELPETVTLVQIVMDLARHLGLVTVAEGVETAEQAATLRAMGCAEMQGYHFSRPLPAGELVEWLAADSERVVHLEPSRS